VVVLVDGMLLVVAVAVDYKQAQLLFLLVFRIQSQLVAVVQEILELVQAKVLEAKVAILLSLCFLRNLLAVAQVVQVMLLEQVRVVQVDQVAVAVMPQPIQVTMFQDKDTLVDTVINCTSVMVAVVLVVLAAVLQAVVVEVDLLLRLLEHQSTIVVAVAVSILMVHHLLLDLVVEEM
jgi:hypothetical protein